jgi:hypothetical protein
MLLIHFFLYIINKISLFLLWLGPNLFTTYFFPGLNLPTAYFFARLNLPTKSHFGPNLPDPGASSYITQVCTKHTCSIH